MTEEVELTLKPKLSRHVAVATHHLEAQLAKAEEARNKLNVEIEDLERALEALGWKG
jgi:LPS O-antigen subunit length determinant protein (WzzB/FepE family)